MLSRQKCGLIIVGDINVGAKRVGKGKTKTNLKDAFKVVTANGETALLKAAMLQLVYDYLIAKGRVANVGVDGFAASKGKSFVPVAPVATKKEMTAEEKHAAKKAKQARQKDKKNAAKDQGEANKA